MYLKSKDLALVLVFDTLKHFRCFSGHRGAGTPGDHRRHRPPADPEHDAGGGQEGGIRGVFRGSHRRCVSHRRLRLPVERGVHGRQGRPDRRPDRGPGRRWYDCIRTTKPETPINTTFFVGQVFSGCVLIRTTCSQNR